MIKYLIVFIFSLNAWGMCNFPHNPAVYCIKANVSNLEEYSKSKKFKCRGMLDLMDVYRPLNTYAYSDNLDLIEYKENTKLDLKDFEDKKYIFSETCKQLKRSEFLITLSCYDTWPEFKDFTFLNLASLSEKVRDPWKQKKVKIDCSFLKEKKAKK